MKKQGHECYYISGRPKEIRGGVFLSVVRPESLGSHSIVLNFLATRFQRAPSVVVPAIFLCNNCRYLTATFIMGSPFLICRCLRRKRVRKLMGTKGEGIWLSKSVLP